MRWSEADDDALLAATREDGRAFVAFYDRYETAVVGYMLRRIGNIDVAVDLTSEVFARALASAHRFRSTAGSSAAGWLFTIAHNTLTDSLRRGRVEARARHRLGIRDAVEYASDDLDRIEALVSNDGWAARLLEALPAGQRAAVRARIIEERSYPEIAQELKTSELVVRKRVSRGLATMREQMEKPS